MPHPFVVRNLRWFLLTVAFCSALTGCGSSGNSDQATPAPSELHLTQADLGDRWPLTVDEVTLYCEPSGSYKFLTFDTGGKTYALNGSAREYADDEGWLDLTKVWIEDGMGGHVDPSDLVSRGLTLYPT